LRNRAARAAAAATAAAARLAVGRNPSRQSTSVGQRAASATATATSAPLLPADARCLRDYAVCLHTCYGTFRRSAPVEKFKAKSAKGSGPQAVVRCHRFLLPLFKRLFLLSSSFVSPPLLCFFFDLSFRESRLRVFVWLEALSFSHTHTHTRAHPCACSVYIYIYIQTEPTSPPHQRTSTQVHQERAVPWLRASAYRRARGLLARALHLDTLGRDPTLGVAAAVTNRPNKKRATELKPAHRNQSTASHPHPRARCFSGV
jgi:hypothetical protein